MKRIDKLTNTILDLYISQAPDSLVAYSSGGWPPHVYFKCCHDSTLRKRSISVPKNLVRKDGTVSTARVINLLRADIRRDIKRGLGYYCGANIWGRFEVFFKRDTNISYFKSEYRRILREVMS